MGERNKQRVESLAKDAVRVTATTYNSKPILGWRVLAVPTSGTIACTFYGGTTITLTNTEVTNIGYGINPEQLTSITVAAGGEVLVYVDA